MTGVLPKNQKYIFSVPFLAKEYSDFVLWFFTGSRCNLECTHCYVESGPKANKYPNLSFETFKNGLNEALRHNFNKLEIYFTGGEPFMNPEIFNMLKEALKHSNCTVLTNAVLITEKNAKKLQRINKSTPYDLIFRVSLDGPTEESNDIIRGLNSFKRATKGLKNILRVGFNPIVTAVRNWPKSDSDEVINEFNTMLDSIGIQPEYQLLKILPLLRIGRETVRKRPYSGNELFTKHCFDNYDYRDLQCNKSRIISENGVWVCPILINEDKACIATTLSESFQTFPMKYMACWTCRMEGMNCSN